MLGSKKQVRISFVWVLVNFIGITTGTLVAFFLYTLLTINYNNAGLDVAKLLIRLLLCGAVQGFIVSGLQTIVLLLSQLRLMQWLVTNVVSMAVGMAAPTAYAIATIPNFEVNASFDQYVMAGWVLSWVLAGACGGVVLGRSQSQKILWGFLNSAAYLYWGLAAAFGMRLLDTALYDFPALSISWKRRLVLISAMLAIGAWLHSYVFKGVAQMQRRSKA